MADSTTIAGFLAREVRALRTRLERVQPFVLHESMVPAAAIAPEAMRAIDDLLARRIHQLQTQINGFLDWLPDAASRGISPAALQRHHTILRLHFNAVLTQFDIFSDALTQRSESEIGVWLAGLDALAADALAVPGAPYPAPPVICYLDRGAGAAIRRVRTRLPGGGNNPVAVIRVPRERMIGSGIAGSLVHEVGHQGSELLGLVNSLRPLLRGLQVGGGSQRLAWQLWERWISEIIADFWSVGLLGITATHGLMAVVSLPRAFVFRLNVSDPHPTSWVRVLLSAALGQALYPDPQWNRLAAIWRSFYPPHDLDPERQEVLAALLETMPAFVTLLVDHRPASLRGRSLREFLPAASRQPGRLRALGRAWRASPDLLLTAPPALAFAVIGQARWDGDISPEIESTLIAQMLTRWAMKGALAQERTERPGSRCRTVATAT